MAHQAQEQISALQFPIMSDYFVEYHEPRLFRWILLAVLASLLFHAGVALWLGWIHLGSYAIPYQQEINPQPFELKRVEINSAYLKGQARGPMTMVPIPRDSSPSPQIAPDSKIITQALQDARPQITVPTPPAISQMSETGSSSTSPYAFSDRAVVEAEINRLQAGERAPSMPNAANAPVLPAGGTDGASGGATGLQGPARAGVRELPAFAQISPNFRSPQAGLNSHLPEPVVLRLPADVVFDFDSSQLRPEAIPLLQQAVDLIKKYAIARIRVDGHTDTIGTDEYNQTLSETRAKVVEEWLRQNPDTNRYEYESHGYGKTRPLVNPQGSADEQQRNRRVEIVIQALNP
jgi:OmpA-OmpF porin, OOP family